MKEPQSPEEMKDERVPSNQAINHNDKMLWEAPLLHHGSRIPEVLPAADVLHLQLLPLPHGILEAAHPPEEVRLPSLFSWFLSGPPLKTLLHASHSPLAPDPDAHARLRSPHSPASCPRRASVAGGVRKLPRIQQTELWRRERRAHPWRREMSTHRRAGSTTKL